MKKSLKKALIGTALVGALAVGAGASTGTLSDFYSEASSNGNTIQTGTIALSGSGNALLNATDLQPGSSVTGNAYALKSTGSLPGKLSVKLKNPQLAGGKNPSATDLNDVSLKVELQKNGTALSTITLKGTQMASLEAQINNALKDVTLAKDDALTITPTVAVALRDGEDQNALQGMKLSGDLSWRLTQLK